MCCCIWKHINPPTLSPIWLTWSIWIPLSHLSVLLSLFVTKANPVAFCRATISICTCHLAWPHLAESLCPEKESYLRLGFSFDLMVDQKLEDSWKFPSVCFLICSCQRLIQRKYPRGRDMLMEHSCFELGWNPSVSRQHG